MYLNRAPKFILVFLFSASFAFSNLSLIAQESETHSTLPLQALENHRGAGWNTAENRWQLKAVDPRSQPDTASADERARRDRYWKTLLENIRGASGISGQYASQAPSEFPVQPGDIWMIATFSSSHVYEINQDPALIYTEMNLHIDHLFRQPSELNLSNGEVVDVGIKGGRIKDPTGHIQEAGWFGPMKHSLQPDHKYLLQLLYDPQDGVLIPGAHWDLSSGTVQTEASTERGGAARPASAISGMTTDELTARFASILPPDPKQ
jgi:hypothetical protein